MNLVRLISQSCKKIGKDNQGETQQKKQRKDIPLKTMRYKEQMRNKVYKEAQNDPDKLSFRSINLNICIRGYCSMKEVEEDYSTLIN